MRPVRLDLHGFASFREPATLDFTGVEYFAIVGPTGSGKSTLIDAMTFALYGSAPRWGRSNAIAQALAPTANRCTVRLVFDVGEHRYAVAREVRRSGKQISQRNTVLEELPDQETVDGEGDVLAGDPSGVTVAVERLLGLSFDDFCKCIVLPQGQFQDFLKAKPADRQTILLKLLGADRYEGIRQRAAESEARAAERVTILSDQLGRLGEATPEAEAAAISRVEELENLTARLGTALPAAQEAATAHAEAQRQVTSLTGDHTLLEALRVPADVAGLQSTLDRAETALRTAGTNEEQRREEVTKTREAQAGGPVRAELERLRDHQQEVDRLTDRLPGLTAAVTEAAIAAEEARAASGLAETTVAGDRTGLDAARIGLAQVKASIDACESENRDLEHATPPADVDDLGNRAMTAAVGLREAREQHDVTDAAERDAREALSAVPTRAALELTLELVDEMQTRRDEHRAESARLEAAEATLKEAAEAERYAEELATERRQSLDSLKDLHTAAALRTHLAVGDACPVCTQSVATLPPPLAHSALDDAEAADKAAVRQLEHARKTRNAAEQEHIQRAADVRSVARRIEQLEARNLVPERSAVEEQLARVEALQAGLEIATAAAEKARQALRTAETAATRAEAAAQSARAHLASTHGALLHRGAPPIDVGDLAGSWKGLVGWAIGRQKTVSADLADLTERLAAAEAAEATAQAVLTNAERAVDRARAAQEAAVRAAVEAEAGERTVRERHAELVGLLQNQPGLEQVVTGLTECDRLEAAVSAALQSYEEARDALTRAEAARTAERKSVAEARRTLSRARDTVVHLEAPELGDENLLTAWRTLLEWAGVKLTGLKGSIAEAERRASGAALDFGAHRDALLALMRGLDLSVPDDVALSDLPATVAGELSSARAGLSNIQEQLKQAAAALSRRASAEEEQQVAGLLADLLHSTAFPRWLAGAALDALVEDASGVLRDLSGGQFDLTHDKGEFHVIDHADADSMRSVRTLSGGETFQASLALALALARQMATLGAGGTARLDSIFLDEGFGTLDPDTLEVVAATLENLAHGERMVGVVTHVVALAERAPTRFVVSRDNRTSRVRREGRMTPAAAPPRAGMRFTVENWDPGYGSSVDLEFDLGSTEVTVTPDVEVPADRWAPVPARALALPPAVLFVDGVRRLEARLWIEDDAAPGEATAAVCASYSAGVVCCCPTGAHVLSAERRRGLFTFAPHAHNVETSMGSYPVTVAKQDPAKSLAATLSAAIQRKLADLEVVTALSAREALAEHGVVGDDLLVVDGPIRGREHLPRTLGYIKSHQSSYLEPDLHRMVSRLGTGERTPVFRIGGAWDRYSWYLRLPCLPAAPWAGIARLECGPERSVDDAVTLADLTQAVLPRFGSAEYKDARAPQNLYPIAGLERDLRHRLGDPRILYRALRRAAADRAVTSPEL